MTAVAPTNRRRRRSSRCGRIVSKNPANAVSVISTPPHYTANLILRRTLSAFEEEGTTYAQIYLLIRPNDPIYEVAFLTFGSRAEDQMWQHTLRELAAYLGTPGAVATEIVRVDRKRQWKNFGNIRHNSVARTSLRKPIWRTPPD